MTEPGFEEPKRRMVEPNKTAVTEQAVRSKPVSPVSVRPASPTASSSATAVTTPAGGTHPGKLSALEHSAAEEAKGKLERMVKVEAMVEKRKKCFTYLKQIHQGDCFWLNCVRLRRQADLAIYATELPRHRVLQFFYLGLGLAKLLQSAGGATLVRSILQLLEEWEYHFALAGVAHQSVKAMMAKNVDVPLPGAQVPWEGDHSGVNQEQVVVARLHKFNNEVVYEHLLTPHVPFPLDYFEVTFSLCDVICLIYNKFMDEVGGGPMARQSGSGRQA
ncbi:unnamed protein product [Discosporangium mesarthrocarpum]